MEELRPKQLTKTEMTAFSVSMPMVRKLKVYRQPVQVALSITLAHDGWGFCPAGPQLTKETHFTRQARPGPTARLSAWRLRYRVATSRRPRLIKQRFSTMYK